MFFSLNQINLNFYKATASNVPSADIPKINLSLPLHKKENKQAGLLSSAIVSKRKMYFKI